MNEFTEKLIGRLKAGIDKECVSNVPKIRLCDAIEIVKELTKEYNGGWIPCEKEYPPDNVLVRVTYLGIPDGCPLCNLLAYRCRGKWNSERGEIVPFKVIAWKYDEPYNPKGD